LVDAALKFPGTPATGVHGAEPSDATLAWDQTLLAQTRP